MNNTRTPNIPLGLVGAFIGALVGIPLSYFFQPSILRQMASFSDYMKDFSAMLKDMPESQKAVIISCIVFALVFGIAFAFLFRKK